MSPTGTTVAQALALAERLDEKYKPALAHLQPKDGAAAALYSLPHRSKKAVLQPSRPRLVKWYCPFAHQAHFPSGHRYCINVYTGCAHGCVYCYTAGYEPDSAACKRDFETLLQKDLDELERFDVPPAPLHLSNSTDPLQALERKSRHTRYALEQLCHHRHRFTTITIPTRAPMLAVEDGYTDLFRQLMVLSKSHPLFEEFHRRGIPAFQVEVSLAFWRDAARQFYDPVAPCVDERVDGILAMREAGVLVVLRIDPLFPRSPLPGPAHCMQDLIHTF